MSDVIIRTFNGEKEPYQAFEVLKGLNCSVPNKISILGQLAKSAPFIGQEAARWIKNQGGLKSEAKLQRIADEVLSGLPLGEKRLEGELAFQLFLRNIPMGSRVRLTFNKDAFDEIRQVLVLDRRYLDFDGNSFVEIFSTVLPSRRWEGIPNHIGARVLRMDSEQIKMAASLLSKCVTSIELIYTPEQFQTALIGRESMLAGILKQRLEKHGEAFYDRDPFIQTTQSMGYPQGASLVDNFNDNTTLEEMLMYFASYSNQIDFLECYAQRFYTLMGIASK